MLAHNSSMRWGLVKSRAIPAAPSLRPDVEREQLQQIIATTTNRSIAEMARIKLRVVDLLRQCPVRSEGIRQGDDCEIVASADVKIDLPHPVSIAPAAHLIDLSRQQPMLEKIHRFAPKIIAATREPGTQFWVAPFYAASAPLFNDPRFSRPLLTVTIWLASVILGLLGAVRSTTYPSNRMAMIGNTLMVLCPIAMFVLFVVSSDRLCRVVSVSWQGVRVHGRLYAWRRIAELDLQPRETCCECNILFQDGRRVRTTLCRFDPDIATWLGDLKTFLEPSDTATTPGDAMEVPIDFS